jgi:hypothetical protein
MNYGQQCSNTFNKYLTLGANWTDTVWLDLLHIDNRQKGFKNSQELFTITANGAPPADSRFAFTSFDAVVVPGKTPLTYIYMGGYNEPRASNNNPWGFRWRMTRKNDRGVEVWSEVYEIRCDQDQSGGWDKAVFNWTLSLYWFKTEVEDMDAEEAKALDKLFPRRG